MKSALAFILLIGSACALPPARGNGRASSLTGEPGARPAATASSTRHEDIDFDEIGVGKALSHETTAIAVARAKEDALGKAMLGAADVFYGFSDFLSASGSVRKESVAKYLFTSNQGVLTEISSGSPECDLKDRVTTCRLRVRGRIAFRGAIDAAFLILDQSSGKRMGLDRRQYYHNEPIKLSLAATKDSYIYVFSWDEADELSLFFPNAVAGNNRLKAGTPLYLPEDNPGISYRAVLPKGRTSSSEKLLIIAAQRELLTQHEDPAGLKTRPLAEIMRRLATFDRREWTLQVVPYEITSRPEAN